VQTAASRFVDGEERRVQEEIIEMLTGRLAKKEKETELLRRQQDAFDGKRSQLESQVADLEQELQAVKADLKAKVELLQSDAQQFQLQVDRVRLCIFLLYCFTLAFCLRSDGLQFRTEAESQRVSLQEGRRQRERDSELFRSKELQLERQADEFRRELAFLGAEKRSLEGRVAAGQQQLYTFEERVSALESRCKELEALVVETRETMVTLTQVGVRSATLP
jgi:hypothetical protein